MKTIIGLVAFAAAMFGVCALAGAQPAQTVSVGAERTCLEYYGLCEEGGFAEYTVRDGFLGAYAGVGRLTADGLKASVGLYTGAEVTTPGRFVRPLARAGVRFASSHVWVVGLGFEAGGDVGFRFTADRGFSRASGDLPALQTVRAGIYVSF